MYRYGLEIFPHERKTFIQLLVLLFTGSRFALMEIKAILYYLMLNFSLEINGKTEVPLKLKKTPIFVSTRDGIHLQLILRGEEK